MSGSMASNNGVLLIKNDGTIQLQDTSVKDKLKHNLIAQKNKNGTISVYMIPQEGVNLGKMFAVLPTGSDGKEGIGWKMMSGDGNKYLQPVFRNESGSSNDKEPIRTCPIVTAKVATPRESMPKSPEVIDLCDDDPIVISPVPSPTPASSNSPQSSLPTEATSAKSTYVDITVSTLATTSTGPTPVLLFSHNSAANLSKNSTSSNINSIVSESVTSTVSASAIQRTESHALNSLSKSTESSGKNIVNFLSEEISKNPTKYSTIVETVPPKRLIPVASVPSTSVKSIIKVTKASYITVADQRTLVQPGNYAIQTAPLVTVANVLMSSQNQALPTTNVVLNGSHTTPKPNNTAITPITSHLRPQAVQITTTLPSIFPAFTQVQIAGVHIRPPPGIAVPLQFTASAANVTLSTSVNSSAGAQTNVSKGSQIPIAIIDPQQKSGNTFPSYFANNGNKTSSKSITSTQNTLTSSVGYAGSNLSISKKSDEMNIKIQTVFSLAGEDPNRPWLYNGKNMPLSEVDFWHHAVDLQIPDYVLSDKRLRKGCSIVLQRMPFSRTHRMRGCRYKDTTCNLQCRQKCVRAMMKNQGRKKQLKLKRRGIYAKLKLQIKKKPKPLDNAKVTVEIHKEHQLGSKIRENIQKRIASNASSETLVKSGLVKRITPTLNSVSNEASKKGGVSLLPTTKTAQANDSSAVSSVVTSVSASMTNALITRAPFGFPVKPVSSTTSNVTSQPSNYILMKMNGRNVLVPSNNINGGQCYYLDTVSTQTQKISTTLCMPPTPSVPPSVSVTPTITSMTPSQIVGRMPALNVRPATLNVRAALDTRLQSPPGVVQIANPTRGLVPVSSSQIRTSTQIISASRPVVYQRPSVPRLGGGRTIGNYVISNINKQLPAPQGSSSTPTSKPRALPPYPQLLYPNRCFVPPSQTVTTDQSGNPNSITQTATLIRMPNTQAVQTVSVPRLPNATVASASRNLNQTRLTSSFVSQPVCAISGNSFVRIPGQILSTVVRPVDYQYTFSSAGLTPVIATSSAAHVTSTSAPTTSTEESVSSVAKSKVNKGTKYFFIPGGVKIKTEPNTSGYGDEHRTKEKKHKKHKRHRTDDSDSEQREAKKAKKQSDHADLNPSTALLNDIDQVSRDTDISNLSSSDVSRERIKQLREKLSENQRKLEEYLKQVEKDSQESV